MSQINVDSIANTTEDGPVYFPYGMRGDATNLIYEPKILYFDPVPLSTGISTNTNITITFDQQIQFSGVGTIYIREGSPTGTVIENFTCGIDSGVTIAGETLVINPTQQLGINTTNYIVLPSAGIANTFGAYYKGTEAYFFQTLKPSDLFSASGGNSEFTIASPTSPTGYHKYHVFTSTGILTTTAPSFDAADLSSILVAGGGGGGYGGGGAGGALKTTGPTLALYAGTYTITICAAGVAAPTYFGPVLPSSGSDSTVSTSPTNILINAYGGGGGSVQYGPAPYIAAPGGSGGGTFFPGTAGAGVPGQGNPGGPAAPYSWSIIGSGGGGGGSSGGSGSWTPTGPGITVTGGSGGTGSPNPQFTSPILNGRVPSIPAGSFSKIGPTGLYAGGGGGGMGESPPGVPQTSNPGPGGPGGGGFGAVPNGISESGYINTGGGGGGGTRDYTGTWKVASNGGSGVFMIRYAVPAP